jgi:SAM-dependent methyltransferase
MAGMAGDTIPYWAPYMDRINRGTWRRRGPLRQFGTASGWLEPGEQVAIEYVAPFVRDTPILDIGVGGGRTAPLLAALSADYRGIDYLAEMVAGPSPVSGVPFPGNGRTPTEFPRSVVSSGDLQLQRH